MLPSFDNDLVVRRACARVLLVIALPFALAVFAIGHLHGLDIVLADANISIALGLNALIPILVGAGCFALLRLSQGRHGHTSRTLMFEAVAMVALFIIMYMHFQFKCWIPLLNPHTYDAELYATDRWLAPVLGAIAWVRQGVIGGVPLAEHVYQVINILILFIAAGLLSSFSSVAYVRLLVATGLCFAVGAFLYVPMPSVGPFLYVEGANPIATAAQQNMLHARELLIQGGVPWANEKLGAMFTGPLSAMPSLHLALASLLVLASMALPWPFRLIFLADFCFMLMESVTAKWHYLLDLPVGIAFGIGCWWAAGRLLPTSSTA